MLEPPISHGRTANRRSKTQFRSTDVPTPIRSPGSTVPQYPITPLGNPVSVSLALRHKYAHYFAGCEA